ncbi:MAG: YfhO family protein [Caldilineaceae bacterium]
MALVIVLAVAGVKYLYEPSSGFLYHLAFNIFSLRQIRSMAPLLTVIGFAGVCVLFWRTKWVNRSMLANGLIAVTALELVILAWQYNPTMVEADILPPTPVVTFLQEQQQEEPFRLLAVNDVFWPNYPTVFGLETVGGYDLPVDRWYSDLYKAQGGSFDYRQRWQPDWALVDFLNVRYILTSQNISMEKLRLVIDDGLFKVYENTAALQRLFMVYDVRIAEDRAAWLDAVLQGRDNLDTAVFLATMPANFIAPDPTTAPAYQVEYINHSENEITVKVVTNQWGMLVSSDLYADDWQAYIDDEQVEIHRANYAFRAISVPPGEHIVRFNYQPLWYGVGRATTGVALIVIASLLAWAGYITGFRKQDTALTGLP